MKALIFSDSHGRTENLVKAMDRYPDFQAIFHLGDVGNDEAYIRSLTPYPVYMVRGNCDFSSSLKESMVIEFGGQAHCDVSWTPISFVWRGAGRSALLWAAKSCRCCYVWTYACAVFRENR